MKASKPVFILFLLLGLSFVVGSFFEISYLYMVANYLAVPALLLYYRTKTKKFFWPVVFIILCFYIRDLLMMYSLQSYMIEVIVCFAMGMTIWYMCAIIGFVRAAIHTLEKISLVIMYCFLGFLTFSMSEMVSEVMLTYPKATYAYLIMLPTLLGLTFTKYLVKSHWASLWLMVASAALLVSEFSLVFRLYVIEDISVNLFAPVFHILMFYGLIQYALNKRRSGKFYFF